jgi:hypothetical protein
LQPEGYQEQGGEVVKPIQLTEEQIAQAEQDYIVDVAYEFADGARYIVVEKYDRKRHTFWGVIGFNGRTLEDAFIGARLQPFVFYTRLNSFLFNILANLHGDLQGIHLSLGDADGE